MDFKLAVRAWITTYLGGRGPTFPRVKDIDVTCIDFEGVKTAFSDPFY